MKLLWQELKRMGRQLRGSENIFGYKSTVANQLYLFYYFAGKIYFSNDQVHKKVKYLWCALNLFLAILMNTVGLTYSRCNIENSIVLMLLMGNMVGAVNLSIFLFPFIIYLYREDIETMINQVDDIFSAKFSSRFRHQFVMAQAKVNFAVILGPMCLCCHVFMFSSVVDASFFFKEEKAKNCLYYTLPIYLVQEYGNSKWYWLVNVVAGLNMELIVIEWVSVLAMVLYWHTICCNELSCTRNELEIRMYDLQVLADKSNGPRKEWNRGFEKILKRSSMQFQKIAALINHLRGLVQVFGSFIITTAFLYGVAVLYVCVSSDELAFVLKLKYMANYLASALVVFQFYWMGEYLKKSKLYRFGGSLLSLSHEKWFLHG